MRSSDSGHRLQVLTMAIAVIAAAARLVPLLHGGGLLGLVGYDDGVYYAASDALWSGRLPYANYLFLHPPGIILALAPLAGVGRLTSDPTGIAVARLAVVALGAINAGLVVRIAHRFGGLVPASLGGLAYALSDAALRTESSTRLEPLGNLTLLLGLLLLVGRPRTRGWTEVLGGACLGLCAATKIWGAVPLLVLALWQLRTGWRPAARVLAGAGAALMIVCGPFFLAAPKAMVRMVVTDQLGRPHRGGSPAHRLARITGVDQLTAGHGVGLHAVVLTVVLLLGLGSAVIAWRNRDARVVVVLLAAQTFVLMRSPSYFPAYAAYVAPAQAITLSAAAGQLSRRRWRLGLPAAVAGALVAAYVAVGSRPVGVPFPRRLLSDGGSTSGCVVADSPGALVLSDVLSRDLDSGCPVRIDVSGMTYDADALPERSDGSAVPRRLNRRWQLDLRHYLESGDQVHIVRSPADGLGPDPRRTTPYLRLTRRLDGYDVFRPR